VHSHTLCNTNQSPDLEDCQDQVSMFELGSQC
jgi:hypothetical protein